MLKYLLSKIDYLSRKILAEEDKMIPEIYPFHFLSPTFFKGRGGGWLFWPDV
jgi:hypothetical protein